MPQNFENFENFENYIFLMDAACQYASKMPSTSCSGQTSHKEWPFICIWDWRGKTG